MQLYTLKGLQRWSTIRARGKQRFVLLYGALYYGLVHDLLSLSVVCWLIGFTPTPLQGVIGVAGCVLLGVLYSLLVWSINERRFPQLDAGIVASLGSKTHTLGSSPPQLDEER